MPDIQGRETTEHDQRACKATSQSKAMVTGT